MRKSLLSVLTICLLALTMLAGCSGSEKVTAESLLKEVQKNTENVKSMEQHILLDMTMDMEQMGMTMDMAMDMNLQTVMEPQASYMKGTMGMSGTELEMENYTVIEDNQIVTYIGMMGQWLVQKVPYSADDVNQGQLVESDLLKVINNLTLAEETEDVNGTEAYVITGTITGEAIEDLMDSIEDVVGLDGMGFLGDPEDSGEQKIDLDDLTVELKYAISKDTKMPLSLDMDLSGFSASAEGMTVKISNFTMKNEYTGFDTVDSVEVPQEVIDSALEIQE